MHSFKKISIITTVTIFVLLSTIFDFIPVNAISEIVIGVQDKDLTYGEVDSVVYKVTANDVNITNDNITVKWYDKEGTSINQPDGLTTEYVEKSFTVNTTAATPSGIYQFTISVGEVTSNMGRLTIYPLNISDCDFSEIEAVIYEGAQIKPDVIIKDNDKVLVEGTDYTVSYGDNTDAGTEAGKVTVTGTGKYKGSKEISFEITKRPITLTAGSKTKVYDGTPLEDNSYTVTNGTLVEGDELTGVKVEGSIKLVGVASNRVSSYKIMHGEADVTGNYQVKCEIGALQVTAPSKEDAKVDTSELAEVLNRYDNAENNPEKKQISVIFKTGNEVLANDKAIIEDELGKLNLSNKKTVYFTAELVLSEDSVERNIGDENTALIGTTYNFDFTNKSNISLFRLHTDVHDAKSFDQITTSPNNNGEYVEYNKSAGTVTVHACKYSTFVITYDTETASNNYEFKIVNTSVK